MSLYSKINENIGDGSQNLNVNLISFVPDKVNMKRFFETMQRN